MKGRSILLMSLLFLVANVFSINLTFAKAAEKTGIMSSMLNDTEEDFVDAMASQKSSPITLVISEVVKPNRIQEYESWQKGIHQVIKGFDGFLGVDVIRPNEHTYLEYVTIIKFDTYQHFKQWQESPICQEWIAKSLDLIVGEAHKQRASGLELWFTLPDNGLRRTQKPAYYKLVIISTSVVFSLILIVKLLLGRLLNKLPALLGLFISVLIVSSLMTYPVFPWVTGLLDFWLFPVCS